MKNGGKNYKNFNPSLRPSEHLCFEIFPRSYGVKYVHIINMFNRISSSDNEYPYFLYYFQNKQKIQNLTIFFLNARYFEQLVFTSSLREEASIKKCPFSG